MTILDSDPLLLAAYLLGRSQGRQDLRAALDDALRERDAARRDALIDPLTGLRNRRAAVQHLEAAALGGAQLWVAMVDVRDLKKVNDTHGHSAGDQLLQAVATALSAVADPLPGAMAFRYGGDESLLCMHDDRDPGQPERVGRLIQAQLAGYGSAHPDQHQPEVSIGWASTRQEIPAGDVRKAAGIALAAAKRIGAPRAVPLVRSVRYGALPLASRSATDHPRIPSQRAASMVGQPVGSHNA